MKTVETEKEGLKRSFMLTIPAQEIDARVDKEVRRIAPQVRMPGFRPGKVPPNLIRKMHGEALQRDALSGAVQEGVQKLLQDNKLRPATQPEVELDETYTPGKDAEVKVRLEALPDVPEPNIADIRLERLTVEADQKAIDEQIERLAASNKSWKDAPKKHAAQVGDAVVMDFVGKVDGDIFEGGSGEGMQVELGSGQLIPGFEDGLIGAKSGEKRQVEVQFPKDYSAERLKGKAATFDVTVKSVKFAGEAKVDDDFAKSLGLKDLDQLRSIFAEQQAQELNNLTRTHMKRRLLDQLSERHHFPVPESMVEAEFQNILRQLQHEASQENDSKAALAEIEAEKDEYRAIAERRVRLGLLLSEIGSANGIEVSQQEMSRLVSEAAQQYQGKDRERFIQFIQQEPMAAAQLRAPLYEDKVVDFLFSKADISERAATREEIEADLESEEGHVHGPGCGHEIADTKSAKAKTKGKASAGKAQSKSPAKAEAPVKGSVEKATSKPKPAKPLKQGAGGKAPATKDKAEAAKRAPGEKGKAASVAKPKQAVKKPPAKKR